MNRQQQVIGAAVAAFQRGDLSRARSLAEQQLATGDAPLLHHLIGLVDCRAGRFDSGIAELRRASEADPTSIAYRIALVRALIDGGRPLDALAASSSATGANETSLELLQSRAEAAFHAGRRDLEAAAWRAICAIRPGDPVAWLNLARSLLGQMQFVDAEAAYRRALALAPALVPAIHELGVTLERTSQVAALGKLLDDALAAGVAKAQLADLWALRALRDGRRDEAWEIARTLDPRGDPVRLNALKAKAADAAGRPAEAFAAATAMNRASPAFASWRGRGRAFRDSLRALDQTIADWPAELPRIGPGKRRTPAFLIGFSRSGTTLTDTFLMGHSEIRVTEEVPMLDAAARALGGIGRLPAASAADLQAARAVYFEELDKHVDPRFSGLVVDKLPLNMLSLPLISALFPDARVLFAQRHPCDCVLSGFMQPFALNESMACFLELEDAADLYDAAMGLFTRARARSEQALHVLVYERLVADPEAELRRVIAFLGLEWEPQLLDHRSSAAARGAVITPSYDSVTQPLSKRASGRWRRYEAQLAPVLPVLLPWAERLGYTD